MTVASYSFLISVTQRQQVAQIQGKPVYSITNVAIIPTSSQEDASRAIFQAKEQILQGEGGQDETASEESISDVETDSEDLDVSTMPSSPVRETSHIRGHSVSSIAEDVIGKRARFGRFAANWLSRTTLGLPGFGTVGQEPTDTSKGVGTDVNKESAEATASEVDVSLRQSAGDPTVELLPKLLRYTKLLFTSNNFFFAYDYDLTRHIGGQSLALNNSHLPLHKVVDELVNRNNVFVV